MKNNPKNFAVAPMMDWTDRHCRYFHRVLTRRTLLYSEMIVADAVVHGDLVYLLGGCGEGKTEISNVALQLGGSNPELLARAAIIGEEFGYCEINLNIGCPSSRVKSGAFGACLMAEPQLVAKCIDAMAAAVSIPVTVKCRIGIDDQDTGPALDELAHAVWNSGCTRLWVHARKAWLEGLSPKQNRDIPPLDYDRVYRLKRENSTRFIAINGGIQTLEQCATHLQHLDGAMIGRAAYQRPEMLRHADSVFYGDPRPAVSWQDICAQMSDYAETHLARGGRLLHITRHMLGLFHGAPGARRYRQLLSIEAQKPGASPDLLTEAFSAVEC